MSRVIHPWNHQPFVAVRLMRFCTAVRRKPPLALAVMLMLLVGQGLVVGNDDRLDSCNAGTVTVLATFNPANQELPDGIAVIPGHGNHPGTPIVGFNPKGQAVYVA